MLGQNFIIHDSILKRISSFVNGVPNLLEIGSGDGRLSRFLSADRLILVEKDKKFYTFLQNMFPNRDVCNQDILKFDLDSSVNWVIVGNIPYYIATPILNKFVNSEAVTDIYVMLPTVISDQLLSDTVCSRLNFWIRSCCRVEKLFHLSRKNFSPVPKVDSDFVRIQPLKILNDGFQVFNKVIFSSKRKTILKNLLTVMSRDSAIRLLCSAGIDFMARVHEVEFEQLQILFAKYSELES